MLDNDHDGRIDGLELLGGISLICVGSFDEKAKLIFEMYDFNLNGSLNRNELLMLLVSCICGINLLTGGDESSEINSNVLEDIVNFAFQSADIHQNGYLSYSEFVNWARSNRDLMSILEKLNKVINDAKNDIASDDSADYADNINDYSLIDEIDSFPLPSLLSYVNNSNSAVWKHQISEPTNFKMKKSLLNGPSTNLALNWAFGFSKCKNSLKFINKDSNLIVYPTAAIAVIYDTNSRKQSFYQGHSSEITCLDIHPTSNIVISGDMESNIHIWNSATKSCINLIKGVQSKSGIQYLVVSPSGNHIASVGFDNDYTLTIYDIYTGEIISSTKTIPSPNQVNDLAYSNNGTDIALVGNSGVIKVLTNVNIKKYSIDSHYGRIGKIGKRQQFLSVAYLGKPIFNSITLT